ncbi:GDSL-type esterase/lipase family protein [Luteimonas sp. S4-F44]|uniref:SGNH/GDSL hydrolase family protein n=1 Tax=Luteimonas sp. S4-F44 TaxID=2925842 RepID=UPI001F5349B7|nr:GDSL-type esterase/lipase family protein [Luteimonas sp. S4-F44]UNK42154.1 GDSL-type esterase/lipase family protein [Luteimonas sp. S4-F44]
MAERAQPLRYLALGDSYTIGEGIAPATRWPVALADALRAAGTAIDAPQIVATTGWTTDELDAGIDAAAPEGPFDLVSLLIGVNDQYRGRALDDYLPRFEALLARAIRFAGDRAGRVCVLAIPDWGVTPFGAQSGRDVGEIARTLDAYNAAAAALCARRGVAFVDIAPVSRAHGGEPAMLADDGLHPSAALHAAWARLALPVVRGLLSRA